MSYDAFDNDENRAARISSTLKAQIIAALKKPSGARTYDDLLLLKSYMLQTEFFEKSILGSANPRQINDLCRGIELEIHKPKGIVFNQGDIGDKVYIILSGVVEFIARFTIDLTQGETEIREKKLDTFSAGKIFGDRALQFDEPRSATAVCVEETFLITVEKLAYLQVADDVRQDQPVVLRPDQLAKKEGVIQVLSKVREKRTNQELEAAASYLYRKVEFFSKLSMQQVVEVCRVAEILTIWGRNLVCKQGEVGPVFYAVLTGSVEVWVSKDDPSQPPPRMGRNHDITEGLGRMENQLVSGKTFGDRALAATDSLRKASIITCEDVTELLVIFRKDYENLIAATSQVETMTKIKLLRRTDLFHNLDMVHLRALANFMEPRMYSIDETVVQAGKRATDMIIIEHGECNVMTEVLEGYSKDNYENIMHEQQYHHYMEDTHHKAHMESGHPVHDHDEYNHHTLKKMPSKKIDILEVAKKDSHKNMQAKLQRMPSTKTTTSDQPFEAREASPSNGNKPHNASDRKRNPRFASMQLVPLGRRKKISLGRIAPNSVLATYILLCTTLHEEVYHPETIIATTLINAYVVSKHAFFNSLPKDSKHALVKLVKEYKAPILTSLWENVPRVLDENQWKMEKTWKRFKTQFMEKGHKSNILDAYKQLDHLHISVNSGNDPEIKLMPRHYLFVAQQQKEQGGGTGVSSMATGGDISRKKMEVNLDWGLLPTQRADESAAAMTPTSSAAAAAAGAVSELSATVIASENHLTSLTPRKEAAQQQHHSQSLLKQHFMNSAAAAQAMGVIMPLEGIAHNSNLSSSALNSGPALLAQQPMVSFRIRQRLNLSRSMNALLDQQLNAQNASNSASSTHRHHPHGNSQSTSMLPGVTSSSVGNGSSSNNNESKSSQSKRSAQNNHTYIEMPFTLVQIHREGMKASAMNVLANGRRPLRAYMRNCGSFVACAKAKEMADLQMEQLYLTLFHSEAAREEELLLHWHTFNGFESMPLDATDHFLIYCRSTPVEFASIRPSKNIFNSRFPALCKPQQQRYAIVLVNPLPLPQHAQKKQQQHQQQLAPIAVAHDDDSDGDSVSSNDSANNNAGANNSNGNANGHGSNGKGHSNHSSSKRRHKNHSNSNMNSNNGPLTNRKPAGGAVAGAAGSSANRSTPGSHINNKSGAFFGDDFPAVTNGAVAATGINGFNAGVVPNGLAMGSSDTTTMGTVGGQSEVTTANSNNTLVITGKDGKPMHLNELSVVQETIAIAGSRIDGLRYAIEHFGTIIPAKTQSTWSATGLSHHGLLHQTNATGGHSRGGDEGNPHEANGLTAGSTAFTGGEDDELHNAILNIPIDMMDPHQRQLHEILMAAYHSSGGHDDTDGEAQHDPPHLSNHTKLGGKHKKKHDRRGNNHSSQQGYHPPHHPEHEHHKQSMMLGAITVTLRNIPGSGGNNKANNYNANSSLTMGEAAFGNNGNNVNSTSGINTTASERILRQLHQCNSQYALARAHPLQRMRICVIPLFRWILIDAQTLDILDFTRAFHEDAIKNIFLAEQQEYVQQQRQLSLSPRLSRTSSRHDKDHHGHGHGHGHAGHQHTRGHRQANQHETNRHDNGDYAHDDMMDEDEDDETGEQAAVVAFTATSVHQPHGRQQQQHLHQKQEEQGLHRWQQEVNEYRDLTRELLSNQELPPQLLASVFEAGLLPKKTAKAVAWHFAAEEAKSSHQHQEHGSSAQRPASKSSSTSAASFVPSMQERMSSRPQSSSTTSQSGTAHDVQRIQVLQQQMVTQEITSQIQQIRSGTTL